MITLVVQPSGSSICGHCCVAMITRKNIDDVVSVFGHRHATRTKELYKALSTFGVQSNTKLTRTKDVDSLPELCIVKLTYDWRKNTGHWMVHFKGMCYCPSGEIRPAGDYTGASKYGRITSYLKITSVPGE